VSVEGRVASNRDVERTSLADGSELFRNRTPLGDYPVRMTDRLERWAAERPTQTFVAERSGAGWREIDYARTLVAVRALAQAFVDRGVSADRGVCVLSENGIDHALVGLAAQYAGVPYAPISPSYSLVATDYAKLRDVVSNFGPGLVYVDDGLRYADGIAAAVPPDVPLVVSREPGVRADAVLFGDLLATDPGPTLDRAHAAVNAETIAKVLYTSGTTGAPKGVTCTQRMLCSNSQMFGRMFPFVETDPPVVLDWLPWNHTFGGNSNFGAVLYYGGSLYVNDGKPTAALAERTRQNLHEIEPVIYFDVPKGFELLAGFLRADPALRARFFRRVKLLMYAGAGMSKPVWEELRALSRETTGADVLIATSLGSTETGPMALCAPWLADGPGYVGVPVPGIEMKLVPNGEKSELRLRGPSVTGGYWRSPELSAKAFDADGFYCIGDALRYVDRRDVTKGFLFDGRISEDFKLDTGTWVSVGPLRMRALAHFAPLFADAVISGENRREIALLAFPNVEHARTLATDVAADGSIADVLASPRLREVLVDALASFAATATGSATRIERIVLLERPPALDAGEITDKGSLNSRAIFTRRADAVERAHAPDAAARGTIVLR
jgi:feruloyl-CoA synthase